MGIPREKEGCDMNDDGELHNSGQRLGHLQGIRIPHRDLRESFPRDKGRA